ncbi:aspartic proteinase PCS1-like [Macadamia integrifolia]|uniref:aspartic proteinase PCS1-like n=1 Tax=Macadamia integrifolia TaxID=60698 RepID=UPI001C4E4D25|nr:aspartic proteinase PCS1-like [Macadamia integrifolia]
MALCNSLLLLLLFLSLSSLFILSKQETQNPKPKPSLNFSLSFPLSSLPLSPSSPSSSSPLLTFSSTKQPPQTNPNAYRSSFKYTMALIVSLPIGTPPQTQQMVLDTGSQLSWIQCNKKSTVTNPPKPPLSSSSFDPSRSSTFSVLPCNHPICKPQIPDFTLPTSCDQNRLCHYSYFYADGTLAEGNLVREKITFSSAQATPPLILGCAEKSTDSSTEGILGMNLGRLSFAAQAKVSKFSYCVPVRPNRLVGQPPVGSFYLGNNPSSGAFRYVDLMIFDRSQSQRMPNFDPLAYTVGMEGIRIGAKRLDIPRTVFRPDAGGSGQTMIDSGTEFTFLVDAAYAKVKEEIMRLVGSRVKKGFVYGQALDICFDGDAAEIGRLVGDVVLEFEKGVEIVVGKDRLLADVGGGVHCLSIGQSNLLGVASNIIGNVHQQNLWVEFDLTNRRVGFGRADCSRSA